MDRNNKENSIIATMIYNSSFGGGEWEENEATRHTRNESIYQIMCRWEVEEEALSFYGKWQ